MKTEEGHSSMSDTETSRLSSSFNAGKSASPKTPAFAGDADVESSITGSKPSVVKDNRGSDSASQAKDSLDLVLKLQLDLEMTRHLKREAEKERAVAEEQAQKARNDMISLQDKLNECQEEKRKLFSGLQKREAEIFQLKHGSTREPQITAERTLDPRETIELKDRMLALEAHVAELDAVLQEKTSFMDRLVRDVQTFIQCQTCCDYYSNENPPKTYA
ncbi:hypothetical protein VNI00_018255 [Paramarasmius palmivorus]|uniref:Uncharacterized protein n=1 Tax=Paramarasmius palmivorus TaxID=297713 RepID=A0AAW0AZF4_9AGAR